VCGEGYVKLEGGRKARAARPEEPAAGTLTGLISVVTGEESGKQCLYAAKWVLAIGAVWRWTGEGLLGLIRCKINEGSSSTTIMGHSDAMHVATV
jgi:hypothetical protein